MLMSSLDWFVVAAVMAVFTGVAMMANRLTRSVSDYLVSGRSVGRYMLTISSGTEWIGAINIVAMFEAYYLGGFPCMWWPMLTTPLIVYMCITGWGVYRFRQTRAMTLAQFLEVRYSRSVRTLAAVISWIAGMVNFGFFPMIGAKLFIALIGLPATFLLGGHAVTTFPLVTAVMVIVPLMFVIFGGHITVLVSDFIQGLFMNVAALVLVGVVLCTVFNWNEIVETLKHAPANASMLNPLHTSNTKDFTAWYFIIGVVTAYYSVMSNVPSQGFQGSAKNAHELRMGNLLGQIRWQGLLVFFMVFVLVAYVFMHHPSYADKAAAINASLDRAVGTQTTGSERTQMIVPAALAFMLPHGMIGLFCAIMFAALISGNNAFMHAWGSVLLQDIILPFYKKPLATKAHIWALRSSILGVALIAFTLSLLIKPGQSILMYFALFNSVWLGAAGAVIIGGLYWKYGTTRAALATFVFGMVLSIGLIVATQMWPVWTGHPFPINGQWSYLINILMSIALYVVISTLDRQPAHNMDKLLYRGAYAIAGENPEANESVTWWQRAFGVTRQFNREDRITAYLIVGYFLVSMGVFVIGMIFASLFELSDDAWARFWHIYLGCQLVLLVGGTTFLGIGGIRDTVRLFRQLRSATRDYGDTGEVTHESPRSLEVVVDTDLAAVN
jgi:solute:Na+ symporter, SSS family